MTDLGIAIWLLQRVFRASECPVGCVTQNLIRTKKYLSQIQTLLVLQSQIIW